MQKQDQVLAHSSGRWIAELERTEDPSVGGLVIRSSEGTTVCRVEIDADEPERSFADASVICSAPKTLELLTRLVNSRPTPKLIDEAKAHVAEVAEGHVLPEPHR